MSSQQAKVGELPPAAQLVQMVQAYWTSQIVIVAARLDLGKRLAEGSRSVSDLAEETNADVGGLTRFLQSATTVGLLEETAPGVFGLTRLGRALGADDQWVRSFAIAFGGPGQWLPWGQLYEAVVTGRTTTETSLGVPLWEYYAKNPEERAHFADTMGSMSSDAADTLTSRYEFSKHKTIVDVGGSYGILLAKVLRAAPAARGVLFDRPEIIEQVSRRSLPASVADRVEFVGGDFLTDVPRDADLYMLKQVLCDWDDAHANIILANCYRAARSGSHLLVVDWLLPDTPGPSPLHVMNLGLLVASNGRVRSTADYRGLLEANGYEIEQNLVVQGVFNSPWNLIEARKP